MVPSCGFDTIFSISNPIWNQIFHFFFRNPNYNFHFFHFRISQSGRVAGTGSAPVISRIWLLRLKLTCPTCAIYPKTTNDGTSNWSTATCQERRIRKSPRKTVFRTANNPIAMYFYTGIHNLNILNHDRYLHPYRVGLDYCSDLLY